MIIKFIKKKFNLIKICAVFTTVCFVVSTLGANLYAIPLAENANQKYEDVFNKASSISAEYGKITASKDANSDITIINIQDLHCHPQTQRNISKIIAQIAEKYNLKEIYVEGGYGNIDLNWLTSIKDENIRKQVTEKLLEEGLLTGSEYYKLTSGNKDVELKGIDEENLHRENVKRLARIIENQGKYKDVIKKVENEINILEKMYVNSRNERFNRDIEKYLTNKIDSRRFYRQLAKYVKDINANPDKYNNITAIRLEDYPNITKFIALRKTSKDIDVREVTQQLQMVINELKNRLPYNVYTRLLSETENLSDSQKVVELITMLCNKEGINLESRYKALNTFLESNGINRELNTVELVQEERQLLSEIRKALSYNNEEYEITFISDFSKYFKDYLEYKLTDADWKYFEKEYEQFRTLYAKYAVVDRIKEIDGDFDEINKYYRINDQRNNIFVANLLKDEEISILETDRVRQDEEILKNSKEVIIAVTGGFHSSELEEILAKKEVNTIVITPSIFEGIEKATKQYKGIIKEQSRFFQHQALAYRILSSLPNQEQKVYLYGALKSLLGDNLNKLKEVLGEDVDLDALEKELQNLQLSDEQTQLNVSIAVKALETAIDIMMEKGWLPKEGGKAIFAPNVSEIMWKAAKALVNAGIFLSNGPIFIAEQQGLPEVKETVAEVYSRMPDVIQEALFATEVSAIEESNIEEDIEEEVFEKSETVIEDEGVDSGYFSKEEKAELLERVRDKNKPFPVDQDLVFSVFEKMIVPFIEDNNVDNLDEHYEDFLRKLFSLQSENLNFLNDKMDAQSIKDLLVYYDAEVIDKNLTDLLARYSKKLSSLKDFSRIVFLFENIEKLNSLSEQDFDYFMDLPRQIFVYVWGKSEDSSQLKTKITVGKKFYPKKRFKTFDRDLAKAYFANAEKLESLDESYYERFIGLNKEAQIFILDNVKSSFDIERIFEFSDELFSDKNKISSNFDEKIKDFTDVRFKALVKYISSVDDMSFYDKLFSVDYYGQKDIFGDYDKRSQKVLKIIVDSIDDANFIKEYLLNPEYKKKYSSLFRRLVELKIENVAVENDYLALKLLTDENFNKTLDDSKIHVGVPTSAILVARYHAAIAVSRFIYDGAEGEIKDYDISEKKELIEEVTDLYVLLLMAADGNVLMDSKTKIYALCNDEKNNDRLKTDRFNTASIERMAELAGVKVPIITFLRKNNFGAKDDWLKQIEDLVLASDGTAYFLFNGHGEKNRLCVKNGEEYISAEELADRLFKLATKPNNPVDLRRVTIDLSCCHSYFFARDVYKLLEEKFKGNPDKESYPTIITAAGLETEVGYTRIGAGAVTLSNLHDGILTVLNKRTEPAPITLGMLALSEYQFSLSNITMFTSFSDETLLERIAETKKHISAAFKDSKGKAIEVESKTSDPRVKLKTKVPNLPIFGFEASIFKEDNYAPIWEELFYRFAPALMLTILISVTMMFAPAGFVLFTKIGFAVILTLFQTIFVKAHIVTDWLRAKDSGGEKSSEEVPETSISDKQSKTVDLGKVFEKDLTFEDKINKIFKTVKERLFAVFSDSKDAESFKIFYKTNKIAAEHKDGLIIPTIAFTIPYVVVMCFFPSIQAVMIATIVSMALHAINNIVAKIIKEKGLLQKKKRDIDFQDIQRRIKHIKLLIENPNVERDLPELKEGSFVLKFGLARKAERRAESLLEYEKIRIFFINRLKDEMAKREEIKAELETIKKARKTKKNKAKIQELEEQLEIMEKEYPRIYNELLFADTKEVEKTIDKIDALLSIFEEIDIILDNIENFKRENADDEDAYKEIKALEEDFLDFAENTFMNSLMSLYNNQKTTGIHVRRVVGDSNLIGTKMLSGNNVRMMYKLMLSSILHDIGKNLVPLQILDKQGSFDRLERNIMEFHVVFGGIILRSSILRRLSYTAENHHRYTLKTKMDDLGKETEVGDLHIPTISSLDEEKEEQIERIVKFLEEINPDLSFDSASQYPKSLEDIKSILEDNDMDLTESQQEKLDDLLREVEQIEEEVLIAKIVSLADVFEAVSPKLSFDSERTYQFPQKIRDVSSMLENIDIDLTESQKREVIVLLAEIAQIDSEEDVTKKKEMEQAFIKKVLYNRSRSFVINYIREKNYDSVRANAFKIVFTKSPQEVFKELGKTEEEFMADFENDPKGTIDECMSLVDADKFEFDSDVIRAFLEFYFSSEDIRVNNAILESLNKGEENRFIVYIKDALYSLYKLQRSVNRMLVRFTPVIASIFSESQTDYDKYFKDKQVIIQKVTTEGGTKRVVDFKLLEFSGTSVKQIFNRLPSYISDGKYDDLGIIVEKDSLGNIISVKAKEGYEFSSLSIDGEPVGNEKNNLNFSLGQISAMLRDVKILDYDSPDIKEDETDKYVAHIYLDDADVPLDADKDGYENALEKAIQEAISGNKLMIIHIFRKGFKTEDLTIGQIYGKYKQAYSLIQRDTLKKLPILSEITKLEGEVETDPYITFDFFLQELLKNHFGHGNSGLFEYPIACYISKNGSQMVTYDSSLNLYDGRSTYPISQKLKDKGISSRSVIESLLYDSSIQGDGQGRKSMGRSLFRNFEDSRNMIKKIGGYIFFKAEVTSKFDIEDEAQKEAAREYKKEQLRASASSATSASTENKESELYSFGTSDSKTSSSVSVASDEDWKIFWGIESILKPFGVKLGNYAHVWEEALFRYLPTVFILLGYMNPLVGLGIQVVFILAHPLAKWMAARMNWEKAKKEGKQVGEKAGIGDLFKQIGKDFSLLTPTLVMMLPYVGALLSLAINPALSLIITPAIFTFTDVIVKWLTKKDSGGEVISIDKNLVIFITIVSLGSYIFLPLIPVIHPIVNALINPIVITNAINAGYLHYEYNKRQQDRSKSLSIFSSSLSEARKAELLAKLDNNEEALNSLIKICREESINFDLSKDTPLTDLKIACFKKYSGFLTDDFGVENPELKRINFFRRLFSLSEDNLEFLYNEIDNFGVELLLLDTDDADYEADDIDANLTTLLSVHKEELLKLAKTDYETFPDTLYNFLRPSNIKKVTSLSKEEFAYLISPSIGEFALDFLSVSKDSFQLKIKLAANKAFGFTMRDIKQEILRKILTIFDNVKDLSDIEKILQLCEENKISSDFDSSKGVEDFKDMRFKAFVRYVSSTDDKSFYNDLFKFYGKKTVFNWKGEDSYDKKDQRILKIIVDSIDDISFIKEYLLNSDRNKIYKTLFAGLADLNIKKVAVENDHLALKLLIDENFNKILNDSRIHDNVPQEKILVARYHAAIAVSRFIYDSVENEVAGYDLSNDEIKEQIGKITELYIEAVRQAGKIVIMDSQTKIYGLFNDEIMEGTERFNEEAILKMLGIIQKANPNQKLPAPTFYKRNDRDHGSEAAKSWLDAMEDLILESTQKKQEKAYFVFRGHGEHKDNEDPDKSDYLKVNGSEKIYAKELAERLFNLATRQGNPVDLRRVTIDLSCCDSYFFARSVHKYLEQMYEEYAKTNKGFKETFPIIISAGGLEERSGITIDIENISNSRKKLGNTKWIGNLHEGILQILDGKSELTLGMLALSEYKFLFSNITIFASFDDEMTKEIEKVRKNTLDVFGKYSIGTQTDKTESQLTQEGEKQETAETKRNVGGEMTVPALHAGRMEMSILKPLNLKIEDRPYIWEEGLFRYLPTAIVVSKFLISLTTPFTGIYVAVAFIAIQLLFISAHSVVKWKAEKSKDENIGAGDLFKQIGHDIKNLIIPTLTLMLPYAGSLITLAINPALSVLITPALITFGDVIVQWLTRKDSGGISINKNLIIVSVIASLVSYTLLPFIPVVHPLVNALINPIVITNTVGAGYLHYEYNQGQQDRNKLLNILSNDVETEISEILELIKYEGNVDYARIEKIFPKVSRAEIEAIHRNVNANTANASQYSDQQKEVYFLFVLLNQNSSDHNQNIFPDNLIHAAHSSIFEPTSSVDTNWEIYSSYKNGSADKDNADAILKMFSAVYAYKTWKDFKEQNPSKVTNDYIEIKSGHVLSFESWVHVCDGHSVFTNGIETIVKNNIRINSFDFYGNDADAINSVVTLNSLLDSMPFIITDPDMFIFELKKPDAKEPFKVYVKRLDDKVYVYVFLPSEDGKRKLISFYSRKYNGTISMKEALRDRIKERVPIANYNNGVNNFVMAVKAYIADSKPEDNNSEYLLVRNFDVNSTDLNITAEEPQLSLQEEVDSSVHGIIDNFIKPSYNRKVVRGKLLDGIDSFIQLAKANVSQTKTIIPFLVLSNKEDICLVLKQLFNITGELTVREAENILIQKFGLDNKIFISQMISANAEFSFLGEEYTNLLKDVLNKICEVIGDNTIDDNKKKEKCSNIVTQFEKDFYNMVYGKIREMKYPYIFGEINTILQSRVTEFEEQPESLGNDYNDPNLPPTDSGDATLPENMGLVNRIMQSKFGNAFVAATVIAFKEFKASMKPSFVDMHQSESGRKGAQQLRDFITRFDVVETDGLAARIIKTILGTIVKGASIVKHIAIDYRYIKASGIQEAISMFGNNTYMDEYGQIHIPPVLIVNDLKGLKNLNNTGIKVNGRYIYQVGQKGMLIYGAEGVNSEDISMAVNESQMIKDAIEQMIREKGYEGVSVEVDGVIQEEGEGVRFDKGITIIGTEELQNQSATYIDDYVSSSIELKRTVGVMYSQKALISLEGLEKDFENKEKDSKKLEEYLEKLKQALYQGRARKIISKTQYNQLQLTSEDIMELRKNGIEIYIDSNEIDMNLKSMGIVGQIVRNNDNQMLIYDYYAQEEVEIEEIGDEATLTDIENKLLNSPNPIMIDIKVLAKTFQRENILGAYKGLNNLIGNLKLKTGIGQLNKADIMSLGYNLDYNKLPLLSMLDESKSLQEYDGDKIEEMLNTVISNLDTNTEIRIILKAIESRKKKAIKENKTSEEIKEIEETEKVFIQIIKERILAKTALTKNYKEFGLKDKKLEILLGEMLYKQIPFAIEDKDLNKEGNVDITYINENNERVNVQGENKGLMEKIRQDTEKAMRDNNVVAINSIIDIILTYGEDYKEKQLTRQLDTNDARNYRAMLSAA